MFCQQCGKSNEEGGKFCDNCGAPLQPVVQPPPPPVYQPAPAPVYQQPPQQQAAYQPTYQQGAPRGDLRNPGIAGVLSFLCCGLGQLYNGETMKGVGLLAGAIIASVLSTLMGIFNLGFFVVLYSIYDAFTTAKKINEGQVPFTGKSALFWPVVILYIILILLVVAALVLFAGMLGL